MINLIYLINHYADFGSIFVRENNRKQNLDESYTNRYQNHVGCSFRYKLLCVVNQFSQPFKSYLGQGSLHKFIINIIKDSKYCSRV